MKKLYVLAAVLFVTLAPSHVQAQVEPDGAPMSNKDVIFMVHQKIEAAVIVKAIQTSPCTFDTFPPVLREMKRRGVPDAVLQAMVQAPYGPSAQTMSKDDLGEAPIYHYAEQLKQMGYITPSSVGRNRSTRQRTRASRTRRQQ